MSIKAYEILKIPLDFGRYHALTRFIKCLRKYIYPLKKFKVLSYIFEIVIKYIGLDIANLCIFYIFNNF